MNITTKGISRLIRADVNGLGADYFSYYINHKYNLTRPCIKQFIKEIRR